MSGKVGFKPVAITLGIICMILAVGILWMASNYSAIIREKDSTIADLTNQLADTSEINSLNSQISDLQNQVDNLTEIVNLEKTNVWGTTTRTVGANSFLDTTAGGETDYAGYLTVKIESSSVGNAYVRVIYSSHGMNYDEQVTISSGGTAVFPILPTQFVEVKIGNPSSTEATIVDTITYYY
jgi:hypothetical protein